MILSQNILRLIVLVELEYDKEEDEPNNIRPLYFR